MKEGALKGPLKNPKEVKGALEGSITMKMFLEGIYVENMKCY